MRALLLPSLGLVTTATLLAPLPLATAAAPATAGHAAVGHLAASRPAAGATLPGRTTSLPLAPRSDRGPAGERAVSRLTIAPFSLLGLVWRDPDVPLRAQVRVRTRDADTGAWSRWLRLPGGPRHEPGAGRRPGSGARAEAPARGSTAPLWVGASAGVRVQVLPLAGHPLPLGLRVDLVDPGGAPQREARQETRQETRHETRQGGTGPARSPDGTKGGGAKADAKASGAKDGDGKDGDGKDDGTQGGDDASPPVSLTPLSKDETVATAQEGGRVLDGTYLGPRPGIVTRRGWGADESLRKGGYLYGGKVKMAFVHHTAGTNHYTCGQAPSLVRGIYRYHVVSSGWRDMGYNFLVDKCGTLYEGRAGGVAEPVTGAHTFGLNVNTMGIAVLGSYGRTRPPAAVTTALARLTAWKLGLFGVNPRGSTVMVSGGGRFPVGSRVRLRTVSGHRDGFRTVCPGERLYDALGKVRAAAARFQGR